MLLVCIQFCITLNLLHTNYMYIYFFSFLVQIRLDSVKLIKYLSHTKYNINN